MATSDFSALRDQNAKPIYWGLSSVDGVTPVAIAIDSVSRNLKMEIGTSVSAVIAHLPNQIPVDGNRIPCLAGQSSTDATVVIPVSVNPSTGAILAQTT